MKETKDDAEPSVLVLVVKSYGDQDVAVEAFRSGSGDCFTRPVGKNMLPGVEALGGRGGAASRVTLSQYHKIQQALRFINENYRTDIRLGAAAREAGMSLSHFSRVFKKVMGLSYQEYLNNRRITKAKELLLSSTGSISEIAITLGFSDPTGFGRIFKKLTGRTPSSYRRLSVSDFVDKKA